MNRPEVTTTSEVPPTPFERNAREVLEVSLTHIDARTRSRLNQARHAAVEQSARAVPLRGWRFTFMPAAGAAAAALLVAVFLWHRAPTVMAPVAEGQHTAVEDVELLADSEALDLVEGGDGSFYEWAAGQSDSNVASQG